jgi:hypothetical protein
MRSRKGSSNRQDSTTFIGIRYKSNYCLTHTAASSYQLSHATDLDGVLASLEGVVLARLGAGSKEGIEGTTASIAVSVSHTGPTIAEIQSERRVRNGNRNTEGEVVR